MAYLKCYRRKDIYRPVAVCYEICRYWDKCPAVIEAYEKHGYKRRTIKKGGGK